MSDTPYVDAYLNRFRAKLVAIHDRTTAREDEALPGWPADDADTPAFTPEQRALIEAGRLHIGAARLAEQEGRHENAVAALRRFLQTFKALLDTLPDAEDSR